MLPLSFFHVIFFPAAMILNNELYRPLPSSALFSEQVHDVGGELVARLLKGLSNTRLFFIGGRDYGFILDFFEIQFCDQNEPFITIRLFQVNKCSATKKRTNLP